MTLVLRSTKGSRLTHAEMDGNWSHCVDSANQSFTQSGSGASARDLQGKVRELEIHLKDFGGSLDDSTDDTAALQAAVNSLIANDNNLRSGAKIVITGPVVISDTILITKTSLIIEGRGWGYRSDSSNTRRSYIRWNGAAGSPMFKFVDCMGGGVIRDLNIKGKTTAKPSAAIEWNEGVASGVVNSNITLDNVRIGSFAGETDAGTQFTDGIVWTGTNNNSEHSIFRTVISGCSGYGLKQVSIQNVNIAMHASTISTCGTGAYITGHLHGTGWNFSNNTIDFEIPILDGAGSQVNPVINCLNYYSEGAGRMLSVASGTSYRFNMVGAQFQITSSLNADGKIVVDEGNNAGSFTLRDFRFSQSTSPSGSPQMSFRSAVSGAGERQIVLDGITGWSFLTGGTYGLNVITRGPTDRTYIYLRENDQAASGTPAIVAQNFVQGLNVDWNPNRFHVRGDSALRLFDHFTGAVLDANQWVGRVGSDGACVAPAIVSGVHGGIMRMTTGASATADMATNGVLMRSEAHWIANQGGLAADFRIKIPTGITSLAFFFGFTSGLGTGVLINTDMPFTLGASDTLTSNATDAVGVLYDSAADTDNWWLVGVANNVDATKQNSAVAPTAGSYEKWRIAISDTGVATFWRNGAKIGTTMSGAVTASVALTPVICGFRRGAATRNLECDYILVECNESL